MALIYASDLSMASRAGHARRVTSTGAVESDPPFAPDARRIAVTRNRFGMPQVTVMSAECGS